MTILIKSAFFLILLQTLACSSSAPNPDQIRVAYVQYAIRIFQETEGRLPESWHHLQKVDKSRTYVKILEKNVEEGYKNDFIKTFRFVPSDTVIRIRGKTERVVAMATRSMIPLRSAPLAAESRLMVVQADNGGVVVRQYTEEQVAKLFNLAGYDIADYTGKNGKWQPEPNEDRDGDLPKGDTSDDDRENLNDGKQNLSPENSRENKKSHGDKDIGKFFDKQPFVAWFLFVTIILGFIAWLVFHLNKRK